MGPEVDNARLESSTMDSNVWGPESVRSVVSESRSEEKAFWARVLTFGDIHTLMAKAEHSRQVLHETLGDLELHETLAGGLWLKARVAQVRHAAK